MNPPAPGTFFLGRIPGLLGLLISLGQWLIGDASRYTHAGVVLDRGLVLEARPTGARISTLSELLTRQPLVFSRVIPLTPIQRADVVAEAWALRDARYGFSAYLHLVLTRLGIRWGWLIGYLERNHRLICSQLVDLAYTRARLPLFDDGRACFEVTPGDLANALIERDWAQWAQDRQQAALA